MFVSQESYCTAAQALDKLNALEAKYRLPSLKPSETEGKRIRKSLAYGDALFLSFEEGGYLGVKVESWNEGNLDTVTAKFPQLEALGLVEADDSAEYNVALDIVRKHDNEKKQNAQFTQLFGDLGREKLQEMLDRTK